MRIIVLWLNLPQEEIFIMDTTNYWLFAREYSIWNLAVTALEFWMADLDPPILSNDIERVYTVLLLQLFCPAFEDT